MASSIKKKPLRRCNKLHIWQEDGVIQREMSWLWPQRDGESSEVPDSLDPALCGVDSMCQDIREAESEKVCVNVHEHVSVQHIVVHAFCLSAHFVYVTFHLRLSRCRRSWGSHSHLGSHSAAKRDGRKWERGGEGGTQPEQLSNVFTYSEQKGKWSTGHKLRPGLPVWVLNSTAMKTASAYI